MIPTRDISRQTFPHPCIPRLACTNAVPNRLRSIMQEQAGVETGVLASSSHLERLLRVGWSLPLLFLTSTQRAWGNVEGWASFAALQPPSSDFQISCPSLVPLQPLGTVFAGGCETVTTIPPTAARFWRILTSKRYQGVIDGLPCDRGSNAHRPSQLRPKPLPPICRKKLEIGK